MTNQEIFTAVVKHARTQGRKALSSDGLCEFKTSDGRKCFAGIFIKDYKREYETFRLSNIPDFAGMDTGFLARMQQIHDCWPTEEWEEQFRELALKFGLELPCTS